MRNRATNLLHTLKYEVEDAIRDGSDYLERFKEIYTDLKLDRLEKYRYYSESRLNSYCYLCGYYDNDEKRLKVYYKPEIYIRFKLYENSSEITRGISKVYCIDLALNNTHYGHKDREKFKASLDLLIEMFSKGKKAEKLKKLADLKNEIESLKKEIQEG